MTKQRKSFLMYMVVLTMMSTMGLIASDVYVPAMPMLASSLNASTVSVQFTLGIYLLGLSVSQLFAGPLSDHLGRRKVLLFGFVIYVLASIACALSVSIDMLLVSRFLQAVGACTGLVVGRATIADQFDLKEAAGIYNIVYPLVAASPAIAPLIGGYLATWFHWQATFVFVAIYGVVLLLLAIKFLPETLQKKSDDRILKVFVDSPKLLSNMTFVSYVVAICAIYGAWFTYLSQSTFLFQKMGFEVHQVGYFYIPLACMIYVGNLFSKVSVKRIGVEKTFYFGLGFFLLGGVLFGLNLLVGGFSGALSLIIPMSVVSISNGIILPLGIASAINLFPNSAGSASGLVGFCQIGAASLCSTLIGRYFGISVEVLVISVLSLSVIALIGHVAFSSK